MGTALVTGASGFIGTYLARALLERGDSVTCLVRPTSNVAPLEALGVHLCTGDLTDAATVRSAVAGHDTVYHLAGRTRALTARQFRVANADGARAVAEACAAEGTPPVLICVSSLAAAGPSPRDRPHTEGGAPAPISHYGRSKRAGELAVAAWAHRVPTTIVRPPIVFGGGDRMGLPLFASVARFGVQTVPTLRQPRFSMVHVADVVSLLIAAADRGQRLTPAAGGDARADGAPSTEPPAPATSSGRTVAGRGYYYVSGGPDPTLGEFSQMIARALGRRRALVLPVAAPLIWSIAALMEALSYFCRRPMSLNLDKAREATAGCWACSGEKAARELGFQPAATLQVRVRQTVDWYRDAQWI